MPYEDLRFEKRGHVATVTLDRPRALNALTHPMLDSIAQVCREINEDADVRVAVFTGAGKGFCAGIDLKMQRMSQGRRSEHVEIKADYHAMGKILDVDKPTIAAVNGVAAGGGLAVALECDIRIASDVARFTTAYSKIGMPVLDSVGDLLPRVIGLPRAMELLYTSDIIDAAEADRIGLVNRVLPQAELMDGVYALAERIAKGPPVALRLTKNVVYERVRREYHQQLALASYSTQTNRLHAAHDIEEGSRAFVEKRDPRFEGLLPEEE